jgi:hypothetical protein
LLSDDGDDGLDDDFDKIDATSVSTRPLGKGIIVSLAITLIYLHTVFDQKNTSMPSRMWNWSVTWC